MSNVSCVDFSIVITNYNKGSYVSRAIRSCLCQIVNQKKVEVLVIDDGSTDDSLSHISGFKEDVKVVALNKNMGVAHASNVGLREANGKYWMRVDADDYISTNACEFMGRILDYNENIAYVYCDHFRINVYGNVISKVALDTHEKKYAHGAGVLFRRDVLKELGGYDENLRNCEDYDLLYRLDKAGNQCFHLPVPLYRYYIHGQNMTLTEERRIFKKKVEVKHGI